jgi:hypothetical protein
MPHLSEFFRPFRLTRFDSVCYTALHRAKGRQPLLPTSNMRLASEATKALPRRLKFTVKALAAILPPSNPNGRTWVYDTEKPSLAFLVTGNDARSFYLARRVHGKPSRIRIGGRGTTIEQAKAEIDRLNGEIIGGGNPAEQRREERKAGTLAELWHAYRDGHLKPRCSSRTILTDQNRFETCLDEWSDRKVLSVGEGDIRALHAKLGQERGQVTANRAIQLIRRMFGWARLPWHLIRQSSHLRRC